VRHRWVVAAAMLTVLSVSPPAQAAVLAAGWVTTDFAGVTDFADTADRGLAVALQRDGRIVVAGSSAGDFALARYNPDGSLDASFGG
jgi:CubicO group peptidase (beta-lactamase class C family)